MAPPGRVVSEAYDTIVGKVCIERGWVTREQVVQCLKECSSILEDAAEEAQGSRLTDMLVSKGFVPEDRIAALRREVSRILESSHEYAVVRKNDATIGQLLVKGGHVSKEQLVEALSIQQHTATKGGLVPRLGEILLQKGYTTFAAIDEVVRSQKQKTPLECSACRAPYSVLDYDPRKKYVCKKCTGTLAPPGQAPPDMPEEAARAFANPKNLLGKYIVVKELGRGGMGVVYKGWDTGLKRWCALKVLVGTGSKDELQRFRREAQTAAALRHPNIVGIFEVVAVGDKHVISMEYVDGRTIAGERLPARKAAEVIAQVARAVEHAHSKGIIHRDIKPHNVMIDREDKAWVMDFGLAKSLDTSSHLTLAGTVVGTPSYMAPEQAQGLVSRIDKQSDVYSLGAVLYEALTGKPPFKGANPIETMSMVVNDEATPPTQLTPAVPKDLETVVLKALEKEKERRYPSARALAEDLERFLGGGEIRARRAGAGARVAKQIRRRWVPVAAGAAALLAAALAAILIASAGGGKDRAQAQKLLSEGDRLLEAGDPRSALIKFEAAANLDSANPAALQRIQAARATIVAGERRREEEALRAAADQKRKEEARKNARAEFEAGRTKLQRARTDLYRAGANLAGIDQLLGEAAEHLGRAIDLFPEHAEALHLRGQTHFLRQNLAAAEKDFTAAIARLKAFPAAYYDRGRVFIVLATEADAQSGLRDQAAQDEARSYREKAVADLKACREHGGGDAEQTSLAEALLAFSERKYARAAEICNALVARQTTNEEVYKLKADALFEQAHGSPEGAARSSLYKESIAAYTDALLRRVNYPEATLNRGHALFHAGNREAALQDIEKAASISKGSAGWFVTRATLYYELGRKAEALADFEQADRLRPNDLAILSNLGALLIQQKEYARALERLDRCVQLAPDNAAARANRGTARQGSGDSAGALEDYAAALKLDPRLTRLYYNMSLISIARREWAHAEDQLSLYLAGHSEVEAGYYHRGIARYNQEKYREAIADWEKCLKLGSSRKDDLERRIAEARKRLGG
jgi:tetratricopeptide (TPR) repeat protein/predicted Ser/Thr protein kinase